MKTMEQLEYKIKLYETIIKNAGLDIFDVDMTDLSTDETHHIIQSYGYKIDEINTPDKRAKIIHPDDLEYSISEGMRIMHSGLGGSFEFRIKKKDGTYAWLRNTSTGIKKPGDDVVHYVGFLKDVTEEKNYLEKLEMYANYDELTGVYTRRKGIECFSNLLKRKEKLLVVFIDIDNLKVINDEYGHIIGDEVIKLIAQEFKHYLLEDEFIFRLGGDEFVAVSTKRNIEDFKLLKSTIESKCHELIKLEMKTSFSVGFADYNGDEATVDQLINKADQEMYQYKRQKEKSI